MSTEHIIVRCNSKTKEIKVLRLDDNHAYDPNTLYVFNIASGDVVGIYDDEKIRRLTSEEIESIQEHSIDKSYTSKNTKNIPQGFDQIVNKEVLGKIAKEIEDQSLVSSDDIEKLIADAIEKIVKEEIQNKKVPVDSISVEDYIEIIHKIVASVHKNGTKNIKICVHHHTKTEIPHE